MIASTFVIIGAVAFLLVVMGFSFRLRVLAVAGFITMAILGTSVLVTGFEVETGKVTDTSTSDPSYEIADSFALLAGTATTNLSNSRFLNGVYVNISERVAAPAMDYRVNFTNVSGFDNFVYRLFTSDNAQVTSVQLFNVITDEWVTVSSYTAITNFSIFTVALDDSLYVENGIVRSRFYHDDNGNVNHEHFIDWVTLEHIGVTTNSETITYEEVTAFDSLYLGLLLVILGGFGVVFAVIE